MSFSVLPSGADGAGAATPRRRGPAKLHSLKAVRGKLAVVVVGLEDGTLDVQRGRAMTYALQVLAQVITNSEVEAELRSWERAAEESEP